MGRFDFIVAELTCPRCGSRSPADESTNMQTKLREHPDLRDFTVGDVLVESPEEIEADDFALVSRPAPGEPIRLMIPWDCPACHRVNWGAEIVLERGAIASVTAVPLTLSVLNRLHYISTDAIDVAQILTDLPYPELFGKDIVAILRERLPDDDSWIPK